MAEVEETEAIAGSGIVAASTNSKSAEESKQEKRRKWDQEGLQQEHYPELPRLTLNLGVAVSPLADEKRPAPALGGTLRVYENYTLQAVAESQLDFEKLRITALFGLPIW